MIAESGRRLLTEAAHTNIERLVTFTQVGWLTFPGREFTPMGGELPDDPAGLAPVWMEGPSE